MSTSNPDSTNSDFVQEKITYCLFYKKNQPLKKCRLVVELLTSDEQYTLELHLSCSMNQKHENIPI